MPLILASILSVGGLGVAALFGLSDVLDKTDDAAKETGIAAGNVTLMLIVAVIVFMLLSKKKVF